jgi:hypothetical protein
LFVPYVDPFPTLTMKYTLQLLRATIAAVWMSERWSFANIVAHLRSPLGTHPELVPERAKLLTGLFYAGRPLFYTVAENCLLDSLVLMTFLRYHGVSPAFVIGVKTRPFRAHAWVQQGHYVLNGEPDAIGTYEPLLAVRALSS